MPGHLDVVEGLSLPARYRLGDIARGGDQEPGDNFSNFLIVLFAFCGRSGWRLCWAEGCGRCTSPLHSCGGSEWCWWSSGASGRCACSLHSAVGRVGAVTGRKVVAGVRFLYILGSCMLVFTVIAVASERRDHDDDDEKHDANDNNDDENCTDGSA